MQLSTTGSTQSHTRTYVTYYHRIWQLVTEQAEEVVAQDTANIAALHIHCGPVQQEQLLLPV